VFDINMYADDVPVCIKVAVVNVDRAHSVMQDCIGHNNLVHVLSDAAKLGTMSICFSW